MSIQAVAWAIDQRVGDPTLKVLLIAIANYANDVWECWPFQATLAYDTEISDRTVRRGLEKLKDMGFIEIVPRKRADGSNGSNLIRILPPTPSGQNVRTPPDKMSGPPDTAMSAPPDSKVSGPNEPSMNHQGMDKNLLGEDDMSVDVVPAEPDYGLMYDEVFWPNYPKRAGNSCKGEGRKKFIALCRKGVDPAKMVNAAKALKAYYEAERKIGSQYVPMVTTWFNQRRFDDGDPSPDNSPKGGPKLSGGGGLFGAIADELEGGR